MGFMMGLRIAFVAIVLAAIAAGYFYVQNLRSQVALAKENAAKMQTVIESQKKTLDQLKTDVENMNKIQSELDKKLKETSAQVSDLKKHFTTSANGKRRDFDNIAAKKPGLVENIINKATQDALRCNELVTGAEPTPDELSGKVQNKMCPQLLKKK